MVSGMILGAGALVLGLASPAFAQVNLDDVNGGCVVGGCSGHGTCVNSKCVCDALWSSAADFITVEDCTLSFAAMYVLWSVVLLICIVILYLTMWVVVARFENFLLQRKTIKGYTLWKNPGLLAVLFVYLLAIPSVMVMAVLKLAVPDTRIGFDALPTALFFTGKTGLYLGATFLQGPLLAVALKGERTFNSLVKFNFRFNVILNLLALIVGGYGFITLQHFQNDIPRQFDVIRAYYFSQALVLFSQFLESYLVKLRLNHVLKRAMHLVMSSDKSNSLVKRVNDVQDTIIKQALVQCIINVIFGSVPYLLNKHAYLLPVSWIAIPLIGKTVALQVELDKKGTKTIKQRFKMLLGASSSTGRPESPSSPSSRTHTAGGKVTPGGQVVTGDPTAFGSAAMFESMNPLHVKPAVSQIGSVDAMEEILSGEIEAEKARFAEFVRARFASDSLNFYDAVVDYEKGGSKQFRAKGDVIMKRFIVDGAPEPIDLPYDLREALLSAFRTRHYNSLTFEAAKRISFDLLKSNFYHKFREAQTGKV